jgi:predicted SnoaL-like aldol condensation-catalyzing enzyme
VPNRDGADRAVISHACGTINSRFRLKFIALTLQVLRLRLIRRAREPGNPGNPQPVDGNNYIQHNPWVADNLTGLLAGLQALAKEGKTVKYQRVEKVLGEGSFVLVVSEGTFGDRPTAYYDLYRVQNGKIAEHWDTLEAIPPREDWKNPNGKF